MERGTTLTQTDQQTIPEKAAATRFCLDPSAGEAGMGKGTSSRETERERDGKKKKWRQAHYWRGPSRPFPRAYAAEYTI